MNGQRSTATYQVRYWDFARDRHIDIRATVAASLTGAGLRETLIRHALPVQSMLTGYRLLPAGEWYWEFANRPPRAAGYPEASPGEQTEQTPSEGDAGDGSEPKRRRRGTGQIVRETEGLFAV